MSTKYKTTVYLVYKCDNWYNYNSFELLGIATSLLDYIKIIEEYTHRNDFEELTLEDVDQLKNMQQTEGYEGPGEFIVQPFEDEDLNKLW